MNLAPNSSPPDGVSDVEWQDRLQVAAVCRLMALHRMGDAANQAVGIRCSDNPTHLITHRLGSFFAEATASDLVRCDFNGVDIHTGKKLQPGILRGLNAGTLNLFVPVFESRPEINFLIHGHTKPVMVISMLEGGLRPVTQPALFIIPRLGYWPYVFDEDESFRAKFANAFEDKEVLIARNHGFYAIGRTPAEAFFLTFYLSQACDAQASAMACGDRLMEIPEAMMYETWELMKATNDYHYNGSTEWPGWVRMVERMSPGYCE